MDPLTLFRKIGKILRGGATSRDIVLGVFLGFMIGMLPGFGLITAGLVILLLALNTNLAFGLLFLVLGKVLCLLLAPITYKIGYTMIHDMGLESFIRTCGDTPWVALMDLQVYCLLGGLPLAIVLGGAFAFVIGRTVTKIRKSLLAAGENEKYQKITGNKFMRFVTWLAFGKKEDYAETLAKKSRLFHRTRCSVALVLVLIIGVGGWLYLDVAVEKGIVMGIEMANGAEANLESATLSLAEGRLTLKGIQVTDPANPEQNLVQAEEITVDVSVNDLLRKRLVMDLVACKSMSLNAKRDTPGEVYVKPEEPEEPIELPETVDLAKYAETVKEYTKKLQNLQDILSSETEEEEQDPEDWLKDRAEREGYLALSASDLLSKTPTWVLRKGNVTKLLVSPNFPSMSLEVLNLSSHPSRMGPDEEFQINVLQNNEAFQEFLTLQAERLAEQGKAIMESEAKKAVGGALEDAGNGAADSLKKLFD
jgi:uncharacterized protein (TIGR03546 family)